MFLRLRIILIPVVPNAGRNVSKYLASLFDNDGMEVSSFLFFSHVPWICFLIHRGEYDNISSFFTQKWLSMPKDLENGFKPNFTEHACPVREYRMVSQSSSDSESILSNPSDLSSDYQCMHSYSSASTIPGPAEPLPTQDPSSG